MCVCVYGEDLGCNSKLLAYIAHDIDMLLRDEVI